MKSYIPKIALTLYLGAAALLGGCGPNYEYKLQENVHEADGFDVEMYNYDDYSVMKVGEFNKQKGRFEYSGLVTAIDNGKCYFEEIQLSNVGGNTRIEKLAAPAKLREICREAKASDKGINVDFGK